MTQARLKKLFDYWVDKLRIGDWMLELRFVDQDGEEGIPGGGRMERCEYTKRAIIKLLKPAALKQLQADQDEVYQRDPEELLVHELLHVRFSPRGAPDNDILYTTTAAEEWAVDTLARVLVDFRRQAEGA